LPYSQVSEVIFIEIDANLETVADEINDAGGAYGLAQFCGYRGYNSREWRLDRCLLRLVFRNL
jgi:hypothetical protein